MIALANFITIIFLVAASAIAIYIPLNWIDDKLTDRRLEKRVNEAREEFLRTHA